MSDEHRSIELEVEVPGTPEQVWTAIATGPGISSWYVPHTLDERAGGAMTASFGPGAEMQVKGRVAVWEPPGRLLLDGGEDAGGLAFEWLIEEGEGGRCIVRLVNSGFGSGEGGDAEYDSMTAGWELFLVNLRLHLEHFAGLTATPALPTAVWSGPRDRTWSTLTDALGIPAAPAAGQQIAVSAPDAPELAGTVADAAPWRLAFLLERPVPGTAFIAAEGDGEQVAVSIWSYLYGPEGADAARRDEPLWREWLSERAAAAA